MKALTLMQPWATLVAIGAKRIETRSWATSYRGPLVIHASKGFPKWAREFTCEPVCYEAVQQFQRVKTFPAYPLGAVLATCRLIDCVPTERIGDPNGLWSRIFTEQERAFGNYSPGRYAWVIDNVQQTEPILAKGALGLWEWTEVS